MTLEDLIDTNEYYTFYGIAYNSDDTDELKLGNLVFQATCDPEDDYRSYQQGKTKLIKTSKNKFSKLPLDIVKVISDDDFVYLTAPDGHIWLTIGTDYSDDYYPCYIFSYTPKEHQTKFYKEQDYPNLCPSDISPERFI